MFEGPENWPSVAFDPDKIPPRLKICKNGGKIGTLFINIITNRSTYRGYRL